MPISRHMSRNQLGLRFPIPYAVVIISFNEMLPLFQLPINFIKMYLFHYNIQPLSLHGEHVLI